MSRQTACAGTDKQVQRLPKET
ncbi:MAG: hypothetical protein JWP52_2545, partial [Rhizobacter sp.]|nr:hypothetical protein [Rhizobacter sp.]